MSSVDATTDIPTEEVEANCYTRGGSMNSNNHEDTGSIASKEVRAAVEVDVEVGIANIQESETERQQGQDELQDQDSSVPDQPLIEQLSIGEVSKSGRKRWLRLLNVRIISGVRWRAKPRSSTRPRQSHPYTH